MKALLLSLLCLLATGPLSAQDPDSVRVQLIVDGETVELTAQEESTFTAMALEALGSSTTEGDSSVATMAQWTAAGRGSRLLVSFATPTSVPIRLKPGTTSAAESMPVQELLLPVTRSKPPDYILIRSRGRIRAFANFGPLVARLEQAITRLAP